MKQLIKICCLIALVAVACKKQENKIYLEGGTAPVLAASTTTVSLVPGQESNTALVLNWTNPNYFFTTGTSSHNVTYVFEMDTAGANFNSKSKYTTQYTSELSKKFTVGELNAILGNSMLLTLGRPYSLDIRITSAIKPDNISSTDLFAAKLTSNVIRFTATPFAPPPKVEVPTAGTLWIVGDAVNSGWQNPLPAPYDVNQKFTKLSNTLYELTVPLKNSGGYKLIQEQGNWGTQYKFVTGTALGGTFEKRDADPAFPAPSEAGNYKLTFNFQTGNFTAVKQ
ncbi:MAG: SusE domain-containing protein [Flavihumibacter sp.]|nr:SusE domain-containing protein [Flavihumibacter sp.]